MNAMVDRIQDGGAARGGDLTPTPRALIARHTVAGRVDTAALARDLGSEARLARDPESLVRDVLDALGPDDRRIVADATVAALGTPGLDALAHTGGGMDKNALIHELGAAIVGNPKVAGQPWQRYALVARLDAQQSKLNGFAYDALGGYQPATPKGFDVHDKLTALREATRVDGKPAWGACVVRIDRETQKITVEFEYDHPERWDVTPQNVAEVAARARAG